MLERLAKRIVDKRKLIALAFLFCTVLAGFMIPKAVINYDFTDYLADDTVTKRALVMMEEEFGSVGQLTVMFENLPEGEAEAIAQELSDRSGVMRAAYDKETDVREKDGVRYERINLILECEDGVEYVRELAKDLENRDNAYTFTMSGAAPQTISIQNNLLREIPVAMALALVIVVAVLFLTSHSYIEPVLFFIVMIVSVVLNMGTNWIFDSISFITFAVAAILQLALSMDYSIMLLHNYFDEMHADGNAEGAMTHALRRSFMPISSSSLTTVAGLAALMFMSFTIGFDIGIVLAKGILLSLITVFLFMPALVILFSRALEKTKHAPLPLGGEALGRFAVRFRRLISVLLVAVVLISAYVQTKNEYLFTDENTNIEADSVSSVFGRSNQLVLLFPTDMSDAGNDRQRALIESLQTLEMNGKPVVTDAMSIVTTGNDAIRYYTLKEISEMTGISQIGLGLYLGGMGFSTTVRGDELIDKAYDVMPKNEMIAEIKDALDFARSMFVGEKYTRIILLTDIPDFGENAYRTLDKIREILENAYPGEEVGIAGTSMSSYDISSAFTGDMMKVNLITVLAILFIILLSFKNFTVPLILVCVIQGAIWMGLSYPAIQGEGIFFMSYLICTAIQMGATIDYGILLTSAYRRERAAHAPAEAMKLAITSAIPTVFTSGIILIFAGFAIGKVCTVFYVSSIGTMLGRGALVSVILVLTLLPALLLSFDKAVMRGVKEVQYGAFEK
ncbi:MAG: MMPL family transporter [Clostridia bacterium]|nr:MMPL family transporter [Clostridia bacterium]